MTTLNRSVFVLILAVTHQLLLHAQPRSAMIIVRGAPSIDCVVKDVFPWGITTTENVSIMFRVVEMIKTSDELMSNEIQQVVKNLRIWESGEKFVLDFQEAEIPSTGRGRFNPIRYSSVTMYTATSKVNSLGFHLDFTPWFSQFVVARFESSFGFREMDAPFANLNLGAGIGGSYRFDKYNAAMLLSFGRYTGYDVTGRELIEERVFVSTSISRLAGARQQFLFLLGVDYYPVALSIYGLQSAMTVLFGFGIVL